MVGKKNRRKKKEDEISRFRMKKSYAKNKTDSQIGKKQGRKIQEKLFASRLSQTISLLFNTL